MGLPSSSQYDLVKEVLINNIFIPCLLKPDYYAAVMGLENSMEGARKLSKVFTLITGE